jgi:hypothetical protein
MNSIYGAFTVHRFLDIVTSSGHSPNRVEWPLFLAQDFAGTVGMAFRAFVAEFARIPSPSGTSEFLRIPLPSGPKAFMRWIQDYLRLF